MPTQCITKEEATSSHSAPEEEIVRVIEVLDSKEDFKVFDQPFLIKTPRATFSHLPSTQVSSNQEPSDIPEAMVLQQKKNTSLFELLESYTRGFTLEVAIQPRPSTPFPTYTSPSEQLKNKRKREKKGKEASEENEIAPKDLEPQKRAKIVKGAQRRNRPEGSAADIVIDCCARTPIWNLAIELDGSPLPLDSSIRDFQKGKAGYALEQPLLLPQDMADLRTLKKHKVFLTLKRDLGWTRSKYGLEKRIYTTFVPRTTRNKELFFVLSLPPHLREITLLLSRIKLGGPSNWDQP